VTDEKASRGARPVSKSPRGKKEVTVSTTAGGNLYAQPAALNKPCGTPKPTAKSSGTAPVPTASMRGEKRRFLEWIRAKFASNLVDQMMERS
jgi:hypothetical protein